MDVSCDLEVDVNGEEVFMVDKKILSLYCGRISKLFGKSKGLTKGLKVIFNDFPGGAISFELLARFCYNRGKINLTPFNVSLFHCIARFMDMETSVFGTISLIEQTEKSLEGIRYWTWPELLLAVRQCEDLQPVSISSGLLNRYFDSITRRIVTSCEAVSPCPSTSSPDSTGHRLSIDTRSTESLKNICFRTTWWFEDLVGLGPCLIKILVKSMLSKSIDHGIVSRFIFYYHKSRFPAASLDERCKITEAAIEMLSSLDSSLVSCKSLFGLLRLVLHMNISKCCRNKLEKMIGSHLDEATLDNLLVPSPLGTKYLYDVNLILRLLKYFDGKGQCLPLTRSRKVGALLDLYLAEVAPDPHLKPSKFLALIKSLPDSARMSYDGVCHAVDIYLEIHSELPEEEKMKICCGLNYEKLSSEARNPLARNPNFPSEAALQALISHQSKLKNLLEDNNQTSSFMDSPCSFGDTEGEGKSNEGCEQLVLYARKLDLSTENEKLKAHLQGMHCRVMELEKVCKKMQNQMAKMVKSRLSNQRNARSLPRLCS